MVSGFGCTDRNGGPKPEPDHQKKQSGFGFGFPGRNGDIFAPKPVSSLPQNAQNALKRGVEIRTFGQAVTWQRWQISGLRLGYPHYMTCDLSSEPTPEATQAVVQNLVFFLNGG